MSNARLDPGFKPTTGRIIAGKYEVIALIGSGWEGEVYRIKELRTGIEYAAKLFFPHRDPKDRSVVEYARKMHKLRDCSMTIRYHTEEFVQVRENVLPRTWLYTFSMPWRVAWTSYTLWVNTMATCTARTS